MWEKKSRGKRKQIPAKNKTALLYDKSATGDSLTDRTVTSMPTDYALLLKNGVGLD